MRNEQLLSRMTIALCLLAAGSAQARVAGGMAEPYARAEQPAPTDIAAMPGLDWLDQQAARLDKHLEPTLFRVRSGLSTSYIWNANVPMSGTNSLRPAANNTSDISVELFQAELGWNPQPAAGDFGANIKFDAGRIARQLKADWNGSGVVPDSDWEPKDIEIQEAWVAYTAPLGLGLTLRVGRLSTLLGAEVPEPWLNKNFSRSYLYNYAVPHTHTGGYATYQLTEMIALTAGAVVGWDNVQDNNATPSAIGQLAIQPNEKFRLYVSGIIGPEQTCAPKPGAGAPLYGEGCTSNQRGVIDVVIGMTPLPGLDLVLNYDYGSESKASLTEIGQHATWSGFSGIASYTHGRWQGALRGEWFQDAAATRTGTEQTLWALTVNAKVMLSDLIYLRAEYRHDESDQAVFAASTPGGYYRGQDTIALELGYSL
ncbi:MAG: outer membrane beta-barrel protein [Deltaproteobacteria bacterium]